MVCLDLRTLKEAGCHPLYFLQGAKPVSLASEVCPLHLATSHQSQPSLCLALLTLYNRLALPMSEETLLPACVVWQTAPSYSTTSQCLCSTEICRENGDLKKTQNLLTHSYPISLVAPEASKGNRWSGEMTTVEILRAPSEQTLWNFHVNIFIQAQDPEIPL